MYMKNIRYKHAFSLCFCELSNMHGNPQTGILAEMIENGNAVCNVGATFSIFFFHLYSNVRRVSS